jgi:hypothetical protein
VTGPDDPAEDPADAPTDAGDDAVVVRDSTSPRRPSTRRDPAAMRETLDAARRRLGPAGPSGGPPQSAAHQRALLREAVASQSVPLGGLHGSAPAEPVAPVDAHHGDDVRPDHPDDGD